MAPKPTDDDGWGAAADDSSGEAEASEKPASAATGEPPAASPGAAAGDDDGWGDDGWGADESHELAQDLDLEAAEPTEPAEAKPGPEPAEPARLDPLPGPATPRARPAVRVATSPAAGVEVSGDEKKSKKPRKSKPPREPWFTTRQRRTLILAVAGVVGIGALIIASRLNAAHVYMTCGDDEVRAERGRFFPWGRSEMTGDKWKPVPIDKECGARELADIAELEAAFLELVLDEANKSLSAQPPQDIERAAEMLTQAELLARHPERRAERTEIERLGNDLEYWRANAEVDQALANLEGARAKFEMAAGQTRHTNDAGSRAAFLAELLAAARRASMLAPEPDGGTRVLAPTQTPDGGVRDNGGANTQPPADVDAGPPTTREPPIPGGGVLL